MSTSLVSLSKIRFNFQLKPNMNDKQQSWYMGVVMTHRGGTPTTSKSPLYKWNQYPSQGPPTIDHLHKSLLFILVHSFHLLCNSINTKILLIVPVCPAAKSRFFPISIPSSKIMPRSSLHPLKTQNIKHSRICIQCKNHLHNNKSIKLTIKHTYLLKFFNYISTRFTFLFCTERWG